MPAELTTREDGTVEMFYTGMKPWHKLGIELDGPATSREAVEASGLYWPTYLEPVYRHLSGVLGSSNWELGQVENLNLIVRGDNRNILGVATDRYVPIQNWEMFQFFDGVVGEGQAIYHTAGSLKGGKIIWILAKLPNSLNIKGDVIDKYILLTSSHDRSMPLTMMFTPVRVVCWNTWRLALSDNANTRFTTRHTSNVFTRMNSARDILGLSDVYFEHMMNQLNTLVNQRMNHSDALEFTYELLDLTSGLSLEEQRKNKRIAAETVMGLFYSGIGNDAPGISNTAYAYFNAITEWVDHRCPVGNRSNTLNVSSVEVQDKRLSSAWFGAGAELKRKTLELCLSLN